MDDPIVIVDTLRTPIGKLMGTLSSLPAPQLASPLVRAIMSRTQLNPKDITHVYMGCVLPAGIGQAPARQVALLGGLDPSTHCTTLNKVCGSGMQALMMAYDTLRLYGGIILAGGMESMSQAPHLLSLRKGYRLGHQTFLDHMLYDGLEDAYEKGVLMGVFAERCVEKFALSREAQDNYAKRSLELAQKSIKKGRFTKEICPIEIIEKDQTIYICRDELPLKADPNKISLLSPVFKKEGTITAANASAISDGAALHLLMRKSEAEKKHLPYLATFLAHTSYSGKPEDFPTAPIPAIQQLLTQLNWPIETVDLFEINEAFAAVVLAAQQTLKIPLDKINIHGGATALGHPIGASGARIVTTLIHALLEQGKKRGIAAVCIGGGEATALALEVNYAHP